MSRFVPNLAEMDGTARRRIYVLPNSLVERVREFAKDEGIPSETEAARRLLAKALDARGIGSPKATDEAVANLDAARRQHESEWDAA